MVALGVTVPFNSGESVTSFASRLAARNLRASARSFCLDMALNFQEIIDGEEPALTRLADLGGVSFDKISRAALRRVGEKIFALGGQKLMPTAVSRSSLAVCPLCLQDDIAEGLLPPASAIWGRLEWQFAAIRTCRVHASPLVDVTGYIGPGQTHDFVANLRPNLEELATKLPTIHRPFSRFESYARNRLLGLHQHPVWLDDVGFSAATYACSVFGAVQVFGQSVSIRSLDQNELAKASDAGFSILVGGYDTARPFLDDLGASVSRMGNHGPQHVLGPIHQWLAFGSRDPDIAPIAEMVRKHVSNTMPLGPETTLYGMPLPARRLHSVRSAARQYGIEQKTLRNVLSGIGLVPSVRSGIPDKQATFDAVAHTKLLESLSASVSRKQALAHSGIPRNHFDAAVKEGLIATIARGDTFDAVYALADIDKFVGALLARSVPVDQTTADQMSIVDATRHACCSVVDVMRGILNGELNWVGRLTNASGYAAIVVNIEELRTKVRGKELGGLPLGSAAEEIGISTVAWQRLIKLERLPTRTEINPVNRCPVETIPHDALRDFAARYRSLRNLARDAGTVPQRQHKILAARGILPVDRFARLGAKLYLQSELT